MSIISGSIFCHSSFISSYFAAAYPVSTQRTILSAPIPASVGSALAGSNRITELTELTDTTKPAWYEANFSPEAGYYLLGYRGPNVPWQSILKTGVSQTGIMISDIGAEIRLIRCRIRIQDQRERALECDARRISESAHRTFNNR